MTEKNTETTQKTGWLFAGVILILIVAINLRPAITSVGPLLGDIGADEGLHEGALGVLGAIPLFAFAVFSPIVSFISDRIGIERTVVLAMITLAAGSLVRSFLGLGGLWLGTVLIGCSIAVANVLIPVIVHRDYKQRVSTVTGFYTASLTVASGLASVVAVPVASVIGWRWTLAMWAVPAIITAAVWLPKARVQVLPTYTGPVQVGAPAERGPWRRLDGWLATAFMGAQSAYFYVMITWLPSIQTERGVTPEVAGVHLSVYIVAGIVSSLTTPRLMRGPDRLVPAALSAGGPMLIGILIIYLLPSIAIVGAAIAGFGSGAGLVFALSLISFRGRSTRDTTRLGGMVQSIGYLIAALGPIVVGLIARAVGDLSGTLYVLVVLGIAQLTLGITASKPRSP